MPARDCREGSGLGRGAGGGPRGDYGRHPANHGAQTPPHSFPGKVLWVQLFTQVVHGSVPPKTGFESQLFETSEAKASRASQSKQAFGKFREKQTGLNFSSDSPGEIFRLLGSGSLALAVGF